MKLKDLLVNFEYTLLSGDLEQEITGLAKNTKLAKSGNLFLCTAGARFDSHSEEALRDIFAKGVRAIVTEKEVQVPAEMTVLRVSSTRHAGARIYDTWYDHPSRKMTMIGITGSKGKTTTAHMLRDLLQKAGHTVGLIGSNGVSYADVQYETANTTPDYDEINEVLSKMVLAEVDTCVLEVSSQAMKYHRCDGITFDYGIFLNIQEGDHIGVNEHEDFADYLFCKAQVLNHSKECLVNRDDRFLPDLLKLVPKPVHYFGCHEEAEYRLQNPEKVYDTEKDMPGIRFSLAGKLAGDIWVSLPGVFNAWNALAAIAVAAQMQVPLAVMQEALRHLHIKGRDEIIYKGPDFSVCIDFAHNGASTFRHLEALREYRPARIICVFGADGNRSKERRYGMGEAAGRLADFSIVTSGHNRFEKYEDILADTEVGLRRADNPKYIGIKDRKEAIRYAIDHAKKGDLITIIGLGAEHWQEENGVKHAYNDEEYVKSYLKEKRLL